MFADLRDTPFEPVIVGSVYNIRHIVMAIILAAGLFYPLDAFWPFKIRFVNPGGLMVVFTLTIAFVLQQIFPVYYRVVPRRLDMMRFSALTNRAKVVERWSLVTAQVEVDFEKRRIELRDDEDRRLTIWIPGVTEPYRFAVGLMQGAISTHEPAPLPDDRLLG